MKWWLLPGCVGWHSGKVAQSASWHVIFWGIKGCFLMFPWMRNQKLSLQLSYDIVHSYATGLVSKIKSMKGDGTNCITDCNFGNTGLFLKSKNMLKECRTINTKRPIDLLCLMYWWHLSCGKKERILSEVLSVSLVLITLVDV